MCVYALEQHKQQESEPADPLQPRITRLSHFFHLHKKSTCQCRRIYFFIKKYFQRTRLSISHPINYTPPPSRYLSKKGVHEPSKPNNNCLSRSPTRTYTHSTATLITSSYCTKNILLPPRLMILISISSTNTSTTTKHPFQLSFFFELLISQNMKVCSHVSLFFYNATHSLLTLSSLLITKKIFFLTFFSPSHIMHFSMHKFHCNVSGENGVCV